MPIDDEYLDVTNFVNEYIHCKVCFKTLNENKKLWEHKKLCDLPVLKDTCIEFRRQNYKPAHFKIYARFYPNSFSYKIVCTDDGKFTKEIIVCNGDINTFIDTMLEEYKQCMNLSKKHFNKEIIMIDQDKTNFKSTTKSTTKCDVCNEKLNKSNEKIKEHCHISGNYRGASCKSCKNKLRLSKIIYVLLQGFNMNLLVNRESRYVINKSSKIISVTIDNLIFIDSNYFIKDMSDMDVNEIYHYFELFSKLCMKYFSIDSLHYLNGFNLGFDILLKVTGVKLDILSDFGVYECIKNNKYFMHNKFELCDDALVFSKENWAKKYIDCMNKYKLLFNMLNVDLINK